MTTSADHLIDDALHRSDVEWLSDHLDARSCPPAVLGRLVRHADPRLRHLGLLLLSGRLTSTPPVADERETAELASWLPHFVVDPPEAALLQANLHAHLGPHLRGRPRPSWRTADLPVRVRIAWLRAELLDDPTVLRHEVRGELLYQAVRATSITTAHRPERLVAELVGSGDRVLRAEALRLAREGLHAGLLTPARVREHVLALLDTVARGVGVHGSGTTDPGASDPGSPDPTSPDPPSSGGSCTAVVVAALRELGEPWAMLDPLPEGRLSVFLTSDPEAAPVEVAEAALTAAARHGHRDVVWRVAGDPGGSPALRRRALELLGDLADRGDIRELTALAARGPAAARRPRGGLPAQAPPARPLPGRRGRTGHRRSGAGRPCDHAGRGRHDPLHLPAGDPPGADRRRRRSEPVEAARPAGRAGRAGGAGASRRGGDHAGVRDGRRTRTVPHRDP
ncbi:hypothetical protein OS965_26295 [Streptomyces sp. H27-G5]|uniref:hypothetical protein n=1 Tax=Streptomyces sp. H27-G5 TaxID=2996698 RepID=UPI002270C534|nr:hypothetical protein [Streptomyces sp. H27-G5]MCY0921641.1 hypothetical protein [Streptomyces sp. H27-G5]